MKTTEKHFKIFKKECLKWVKRFGLDNYEIRFLHKVSYNEFAYCKTNLNAHRIVFILSKEWKNNVGVEPIEEEIRRVAKHEAIHALLERVKILGEQRWVEPREYDEAFEELVIKLEKIIE